MDRMVPELLSGEEIVLAVLDKIGELLRRDCYLTPMSAYEFFKAEVTVNLTASDVGRQVAVNRAIVASGGAVSSDVELESVEATLTIDPDPPNEVRIETGQPVPVLSRDESGRPLVRAVKYARRGKGKAE